PKGEGSLTPRAHHFRSLRSKEHKSRRQAGSQQTTLAAATEVPPDPPAMQSPAPADQPRQVPVAQAVRPRAPPPATVEAAESAKEAASGTVGSPPSPSFPQRSRETRRPVVTAAMGAPARAHKAVQAGMALPEGAAARASPATAETPGEPAPHSAAESSS